jgi:hypothetical protein
MAGVILLAFYTAIGCVTAIASRPCSVVNSMSMSVTLQTRDVLFRIMRDQETHYGLRLGVKKPAPPVRQRSSSVAGGEDGTGADAPVASLEMDEDGLLDVEGVKAATLRKVLDIVYASAFPELEDQQRVRELIARHFSYGVGSASRCLGQQQAPAAPAGDGDGGGAAGQQQDAEPPAIDTSVPGVVRVGSIYMERGDEPGSTPPLVHTRGTLQRLEMLAAATRSGRTVCLEGDTASGKTALVAELARLAGMQLRVLPMTAESGASCIVIGLRHACWHLFFQLSRLQ